MPILYILLAAIAAELTFVITFIITYGVALLLNYIYAFLKIKNRYRLMSDGILCGASCIFFSCFVCLLVLKNQNFSEIKIIIIALLLPLIGEIGYWKHLTKKKSVSFVDRFHIAMKVFPQRGQFAINWSTLSEKMIASGEIRGIEDMRNEETLQKMKTEAYEITQGYLAILFLWSILGYILGLFLVHHFLF